MKKLIIAASASAALLLSGQGIAQQSKAMSDDEMFYCAFVAAFFSQSFKNSSVPEEQKLHREVTVVFNAYKKYANAYIQKNKLGNPQIEAVTNAVDALPFETKLNTYIRCRDNPKIKPYM